MERCPVEIPANYIVCPSHWRKIPKSLKEALRASSRQHAKELEAYQKLKPDDPSRVDAYHRVVGCLLDFQEAHDGALALLSVAA